MAGAAETLDARAEGLQRLQQRALGLQQSLETRLRRRAAARAARRRMDHHARRLFTGRARGR